MEKDLNVLLGRRKEQRGMEQKQNRFALRQPGLARRIKPWLSRAA